MASGFPASGRTAAREGVPHLVTTSREAERVHLLAYLADLLNDRAQVEKSVHSALAAGRDASGERHSLENINRRIELAREAIERINDAVEERDQPIEADEYGIEEREDTRTGEGLREPSRHSSYPARCLVGFRVTPPPYASTAVGAQRGAGEQRPNVANLGNNVHYSEKPFYSRRCDMGEIIKRQYTIVSTAFEDTAGRIAIGDRNGQVEVLDFA